MDIESSDLDQRRRSLSLGRQSSTNSSLRTRSFNLSGRVYTHLNEDGENETLQVELGDREFSSKRYRESGSRHSSINLDAENGVVVPLQEEEMKQVPPWLEYVSCMIFLSVFGILGVMTRYLLQKLFGPGVMGVTGDGTILYLDLPPNMIGSFLMGWFGVVFKAEISSVSNQLAIGLSTGYLGSLTTFSSWNQKMLDLSVNGHWTFAVLGFLLGLFLVGFSIILGIDSARGIRWLFKRLRKGSDSEPCSFEVNTIWRHTVVIIVLVLMWVALWIVSINMETREFHDGGLEAQLWLGCLVGPFGVWVRWWLARLNGCGLGMSGLFKWLPVGTLAANILAACMMAALETIKKAVDTETSVTVASGIQLGFLGSLSTVSTMMAEFNAMRESNRSWRAYVYVLITITTSFGLGTLIYSVPVWKKGYK